MEATNSPRSREALSLEFKVQNHNKILRFSPYKSNITPLLTEVWVAEHLLDMPQLLGPLPCHQVKLPGHHQKVVMVKAVICISTGSGAEDPPGGQDGSSTVMTTKA